MTALFSILCEFRSWLPHNMVIIREDPQWQNPGINDVLGFVRDEQVQ